MCPFDIDDATYTRIDRDAGTFAAEDQIGVTFEAVEDGTGDRYVYTIRFEGVSNTNFVNSRALLADTTAPRITSITRGGAAQLTNADTLTFEVTFDEFVNFADSGDFSDDAGLSLIGQSANTTDNITYTVTLGGAALANANATVGLVVTTAGSIQDGSGNFLTNATPTGANENYTVDNVATATVDIVDTILTDGDNASLVNITFGEPVNGFSTGGLTLAGGTVSGFSFSDGDSSASFTFTAQDNFDGTGSVTVNAGSYTDDAGNAGATASDTVTVDTVNPTLQITFVESVLNLATPSTTVNFAFSEPVNGFVVGDLTPTGGTLSNFSFTDGNVSGSATFTANVSTTTTGSIAVANGAYTDANANAGVGDTETIPIDTQAPSLRVSSGNTAPVRAATGVAANTNIRLDFGENIELVSGQTVSLVDASSGLRELFTASSTTAGTGGAGGTLTVSGAEIVLNPGLDLVLGRQYAVQFPGTAIQDSAGNPHPAISDTTTYFFTTLPEIAIAVSPTTIDEDGGVGTFTVSLRDGLGGAFTATENVGITVNLSTSSATLTSDYTLSGFTGTSDTVTISSGSTNATFTATAVNDQPTSDDGETLTATLAASTSTGTAQVSSSANSATVTIEENYGPVVTGVTGPFNGTYTEGANLSFEVQFDQQVVENTSGGTPSLSVVIGSTTVQAPFVGVVGGSGNSALQFSYTVQSGDLDTDGIALAALNLNGGSIQNVGGNDADLTLNGVASLANVQVDAVLPTVSSVTVPTNDTYIIGETLDFTVNFTETVNVVTTSGTPQLAVTIGSTTVQAVYVPAAASTSALFRYTVQAGDEDSDGIAVGTLSANGGSLRDAAGNDATLTLNSVGATTGVLVDGVVPTLTNITTPPNGLYGALEVLAFELVFSEPVTLTTTSGSPVLNLTIGSNTRQVVLGGGNGTNTLQFGYTTTPGDLDLNGIQVASLGGAGLALADLAGNAGSTAFTPLSLPNVQIDTIAPQITNVTFPSAATYKIGDVLAFDVVFNEDVTVTGTPLRPITIGSTLRNATFSSQPNGDTLRFRYTVQAGDIDGDGIDLGANVDANGGAITDAAANPANLHISLTPDTSGVLIDGVAPTLTSITRNTPATAQTNADTLVFDVTFSEAVENVGAADFAPTGAVTTASLSVSPSTGPSATYTVTMTGAQVTSGNGSVGLALAAGASIADGAGNGLTNLAATGTTETFTLDNTAPQLTAVSLDGPFTALTNADTLNFEAIFDEAPVGLSPADFAVVGGAGTVTNVASGSATAFTVTVSGNGLDAHNGTIGLTLAATPAATDAVGNVIAVAGTLTANEAFTVDNQTPTVTSITRSSPTGAFTDADTLIFTVAFSEAVTGVTTADFAVNGGAGAVSAVSGASGTSVDVTVTGAGLATFNGTVGLDIAAAPAAADGAGNALSNTEPATDETFTLDNTDPRVTSILRKDPTGERTNADSLTFTVTFSEDMANVDAADFESGGITGASVVVTPTSASVYDVTLSGALIADGNGAVSLGFAAGQDITDASGVNALADTSITGSTETYELDNVAPTVASIERLAVIGEQTNLDTLTFTVTFSEAMASIGAANFVVDGAAGAVASVQNANLGTPGGTPASVEVVVSGNGLDSFDGTVGLNVTTNPSSTDLFGNALQAVEPATDEAYTVDNTAPTITSITRLTPSDEITNADALVFLVTFSETVSSISSADFAVNGGAGSFFSRSDSSGTTTQVRVANNNLASFNGVVGLNVGASPNARDAAGNLLATVEPSTDETYTLDNLGPSVTAIERSQPTSAQTNADTLVFGVTFSDPIVGLSRQDFRVNGSAGAVTGVATTSATTADVTVQGNGVETFDGTVGLDLAPSPLATDTLGNELSNVEPATDETYTLDNTVPSVTLNAAAGPFTGGFLVTITFSEAVVDFVQADLTVGNGTASGLTTSDNTTFTATITPTADGTVTVDLAAGVATDAAANGNTAANQLSRVVDVTIPSIEITAPAVTGGSVNGPFDITVTFSEDVTGFVVGDIVVSNGTASGFAGSGAVYTATITPTADGLVTVDVPAGAASDLVGNLNTAATQFSVIDDETAPTVTLTPPSGPVGQTFSITLTFSEPVTGFDLSDLNITNGTASNLVTTDGGTTWTVDITSTNSGAVDVALADFAVQVVPPSVVTRFDAVPLVML
ncbi:MAG: Ig-like domain-containing protein, partial [Pseudomonadota bacterium]